MLTQNKEYNYFDFYDLRDVSAKIFSATSDSLIDKIFEIFHTSTDDFITIIEKILYKQFLERRDVFSLEELVGIYNSLAISQPFSANDLDKIIKYKTLLSLCKHNLISFTGIDEYGEKEGYDTKFLKALKKETVIDPILLCKKAKDSNELYHLLEMHESSDVLLIKQKLKNRRTLSLNSILKLANKDKSLTYQDWLEQKRKFLLLNQLKGLKLSNQQFNKIRAFELSKPFKLTKNGREFYHILKQKVNCQIFVSFEEMNQLQELLGPYYFTKACRNFQAALNKFNK